jgi:hypothetical protein
MKGLMSFQENIWIMIKQSLNLARRKAQVSKTIKFVLTQDSEHEDLNYDLEWIKIVIQGSKEQEKEEYDEAMGLYRPLNKTFKKEMPKDERMMMHIKTKVLSTTKVDEAYKKGYGAIGDNNISNKLLEMGIITHIELIEDYDTRDEIIKFDM